MMPFPDDYKEALLSGSKNTTIRVGEEMGKYQVGEKYRAGSYTREDWGVEVLVEDTKTVNLEQLPEFGVPEKEIERVKSETDDEQAEVIKFEIKD